jgi:hypothetical protein
VQMVAGQADCVVRTSDTLGATWSAEVVVHGSSSADQHLPSIAVDALTGVVLLAYFDAGDDPLGLSVVRRSCASDDGLTWSAPLTLSAVATVATPGGAETDDVLVHAGLALHGGCAAAAWCDNGDREGINPDGAGASFDVVLGLFQQMP